MRFLLYLFVYIILFCMQTIFAEKKNEQQIEQKIERQFSQLNLAVPADLEIPADDQSQVGTESWTLPTPHNPKNFEFSESASINLIKALKAHDYSWFNTAFNQEAKTVDYEKLEHFNKKITDACAQGKIDSHDILCCLYSVLKKLQDFKDFPYVIKTLFRQEIIGTSLEDAVISKNEAMLPVVHFVLAYNQENCLLTIQQVFRIFFYAVQVQNNNVITDILSKNKQLNFLGDETKFLNFIFLAFQRIRSEKKYLNTLKSLLSNKTFLIFLKNNCVTQYTKHLFDLAVTRVVLFHTQKNSQNSTEIIDLILPLNLLSPQILKLLQE